MSVEHGYQPLGKFSSARDDILHFLCLSEWSTGSTGNSVDWFQFSWKISNEPAEVQVSNTEITSLLEEWFQQNPEVTDSEELRSELVGHFIVTEHSGGSVSVAKYATEAEMKADFQAIEAQFNEWDEQGE